MKYCASVLGISHRAVTVPECDDTPAVDFPAEITGHMGGRGVPLAWFVFSMWVSCSPVGVLYRTDCYIKLALCMTGLILGFKQWFYQ